MIKLNVLDSGYVKLIEAYGHGVGGMNYMRGGETDDNEVGIIEAARQSTQASFRGWYEDSKLLAFLNNNHHTTPFEFAGMVIEVKLPIFVVREWHRHRTQSYNEMSARYAPLPNENYTPTFERLFMTQEKNKQAQAVTGSIELTELAATGWLADTHEIYRLLEEHYQRGLDFGIPKEIARIALPVGRYTQMRASANLLNWLKFCSLRSTKSNPNAQYEIRMFADAVETIIEATFPRTFALFNKLREVSNENS